MRHSFFPAGLIFWALVLPVTTAQDEALFRERNMAVAHFHNEDYEKAAIHFAKAMSWSRESVEDQINLGLSHVLGQHHDQAISTLLRGRVLLKDSPHIAYLLAIVYARIGDYQKAKTEFETVIRLDPLCAPAHYNLGMVLKRLDLLSQAEIHWKKTIELDATHAPAYFALFTHYSQTSRTKEATKAFQGYSETKTERASPTSMEDVERSRYCHLLPYPVLPQGSLHKALPVVLETTTSFGLENIRAPWGVVFIDFDGDGDEDLWTGEKVYRKDANRFVDVTKDSGLETKGPISCLETADFDGDGALDLLFCEGSNLTLGYGNKTTSFRFQTSDNVVPRVCPAKMQPTQAKAVDVDHEGDLDLLVLCATEDKTRGSVTLLRNNGNRTFADITASSKLAIDNATASHVIVSDLDNGNDVDFFVALLHRPHKLFLNQRDGTFQEQRANQDPTSLGKVAAIDAGDVNGDGKMDLVALDTSGHVVVWNNIGNGHFSRDRASPGLDALGKRFSSKVLVLFDVDNDGDLDLFVTGGSHDSQAAFFRNDFVGGWTEETASVVRFGKIHEPVQQIVPTDLDNDGDQDLVLVTSSGGIQALHNKGGEKNRSVRIRLNGRKNNSDGYGAKIVVTNGRFSAFREVRSRWTSIGVGKQKDLQSVSVRWPTGIEQSEIDVRVKKSPHKLDIAERPGLAESCPFVFAFDGKKFRFVTDILDTTPLGVSLFPGVPFVPNHREAILIEGEKLQPDKDGWLRLQITQELAEITYLDRLRLYVVDHPQGSRVVPNDRFSDPPFAPFHIHVVSDPKMPSGSWDKTGRDVRATLEAANRTYAFEVPYISPRYPGVTKRWELILDPGDFAVDSQIWLFLRGTMLWADASVNMAVSQNPDVSIEPVSLEIIDKKGNWKKVRSDLGVPAGMDKFLPIDLTGLFESNDHRIRLSSTFALLWDQAFFSIRQGLKKDVAETYPRLSPLKADLHYRGFSQPVSPDEQLPDLFDYDRLLSAPLFPVAHRGMYTKYGRVEALLAESDNEFVILAPGDECTVEFPGHGLGPVPAGWRRDYILDAEGYIKDADWRTAYASTVEPLPFRGMTKYPPPGNKRYPVSAHELYLENYQTRMIPADLWVRQGKI